MSPKTLEVKELKAIVDWVSVTDDISEFSLKYGDIDLHISRNGTAPQSSQYAPMAPIPAVAAEQAPPAPPVAVKSAAAQSALAVDEVLVKAPMVGTFYAAAKPGEPDFVAAGDKVGPESVLCIVEVMKLMNNIEAGIEGTIARILVSNEEAVQYGQPLMVIKRN